MKTDSKLDWKGVGQFLAIVVNLVTIVREEFQRAKIPLEIMGWLVRAGKQSLEKAIEGIVEDWKSYWLQHFSLRYITDKERTDAKFMSYIKAVDAWKGDSLSEGLKGDPLREMRVSKLQEIDWLKVEWGTHTLPPPLELKELKMQSQTGWHWRNHFNQEDRIFLTGEVFFSLLWEEDNYTLELLRERFGITYLHFLGEVFIDWRGRPFICVLRFRGTHWMLDQRYMDEVWDENKSEKTPWLLSQAAEE